MKWRQKIRERERRESVVCVNFNGEILMSVYCRHIRKVFVLFCRLYMLCLCDQLRRENAPANQMLPARCRDAMLYHHPTTLFTETLVKRGCGHGPHALVWRVVEQLVSCRRMMVHAFVLDLLGAWLHEWRRCEWWSFGAWKRNPKFVW